MPANEQPATEAAWWAKLQRLLDSEIAQALHESKPVIVSVGEVQVARIDPPASPTGFPLLTPLGGK